MNKLLKITAVVMMLVVGLSVLWALVIYPPIKEKNRLKKLNACLVIANGLVVNFLEGAKTNADFTTLTNLSNMKRNDCYNKYPIR